MTPDKLPEEISQQISYDAEEAYPPLLSHTHIDGPRTAYRKGATAWAPWKVKYDELNMRKAGELAELQLRLLETFERNEQLQAQAQRMVDALEEILKQHTYYDVIELAANALQQFKDGKGKDNPCPHCGKELSRDRNLCCRECGKEVEK